MIRRLAALLLVLLIGSLVLGPAYAISDPAEMMRNPAQEARAEQIGRQLRCLVCQNESIEDSSADLARDLRAIVRQRVAAGDTDAQITAWMVARYGNFVRLRPPFNALTALLWFSPVLAVLVGLGIALLGRARPPGAATAERGRASAHRGADPVMIWLAVAVLAICAMAPVAWALGVHISPRGRAEAAVALHRAQLAELDRDLADGRIAPAEHATALLEVQRRLLAASEMHDAAPGRGSAAPLLVAVVLVPAVAVGLYSLNGHPDMPSMPRAQQLASAEQRAAEEAAMVVQLRQVLAGLDPHSDRARDGYVLLGNVEESRGHYADAADAWGKALDLRFDPLLAAQSAEAASLANGGRVSPAAAALFRRALAEAPANAPWRAAVQQRLDATTTQAN